MDVGSSHATHIHLSVRVTNSNPSEKEYSAEDLNTRLNSFPFSDERAHQMSTPKREKGEGSSSCAGPIAFQKFREEFMRFMELAMHSMSTRVSVI